jgi:hypothetical protein
MQRYDAQPVADDLDRECVGFGQWELIPREALVLGGNVFELGRCYYHTRQPEAPQESFEWLRQNPSDVDWRDRLYVEQRIAGCYCPLSKESMQQDVNVCKLRTMPICSSSFHFLKT